MLGDRLDCPNCGYPYSEEYLESMIWKTFLCDSCKEKIVVQIRKGFLLPIIRYDRNYYRNLNKERINNFAYMKKVIPGMIKDSANTFNQEMYQQFFIKGQYPWVKKARKLFIEWCGSVGIGIRNIELFFEDNNGKIDHKTIKKYLNG